MVGILSGPLQCKYVVSSRRHNGAGGDPARTQEPDTDGARRDIGLGWVGLGTIRQLGWLAQWGKGRKSFKTEISSALASIFILDYQCPFCLVIRAEMIGDRAQPRVMGLSRQVSRCCRTCTECGSFTVE